MNNTSIIAFESKVRTVDATFEIDNNPHNGADFILDTTAFENGTNTVTLHIDGYDPASGKWYTILDGAAVSTATTNLYRVFPGSAVTSNVSANACLPRKFRVQLIKNAQVLEQTASLGINFYNA